MRLADDPIIQRQFLELIKQNKSNMAMAKILGVSRPVVTELRQMFGYTGVILGRVPAGARIFDKAANRKRFLRLYYTGLTDNEIAARMHYAISTIGNYRRSLGLIGNGGSGYGGWRVNNTTRAQYRGKAG